MKRMGLFIWIVLVVVAFALQVRGANLEVEVTDVVAISSGDTTRFLLQFDLPSQLVGSTIDYAELRFSAQPDSGLEQPLDIAGYRLTAGWDMDAVSWTYPWANPGGDYNDSTLTVSTLSGEENQRVSLDLTGILSAWAKGRPSYGLILKPLIEKGRNFTVVQDAEFPPGVKAKVEVYYTAKEVSK